jgi:phosphoribosylamine--glycine ligase
MREIIRPIISAMNNEGRRYRGVLYVGIMVSEEGPKVLEFNARFGDPETQVILPRLKDDLVSVMEEIVDGKLTKRELSWNNEACVCVVLASGGYPGKHEKGKKISGLEEAGEMEDIFIFHAGTKLLEDKQYITNGGRVLGVTALGDNIRNAVSRVYEAVGRIRFDNMHYRKDIGYRAIKKEIS